MISGRPTPSILLPLREDEAVRDAESLLAGGYRRVGRWDLSQIKVAEGRMRGRTPSRLHHDPGLRVPTAPGRATPPPALRATFSLKGRRLDRRACSKIRRPSPGPAGRPLPAGEGTLGPPIPPKFRVEKLFPISALMAAVLIASCQRSTVFQEHDPPPGRTDFRFPTFLPKFAPTLAVDCTPCLGPPRRQTAY